MTDPENFRKGLVKEFKSCLKNKKNLGLVSEREIVQLGTQMWIIYETGLYLFVSVLTRFSSVRI